ncbi:MAG: transposase [Deltaproteobacteria bacterium]|nr:transposase [Deltaproteobacteria bacterium]
MNWHPHLHVLAPAGTFRTDGSFIPSPVFDAAVLRGLFQANVLSLLLRERMISPDLVERMKDWRHSGFHAYTGEEIPDIPDALRVGLYMVRGPAATSRLHADPDQDPKVRYLAKGAVPDHGEERMSSGHRDYDYAVSRPAPALTALRGLLTGPPSP